MSWLKYGAAALVGAGLFFAFLWGKLGGDGGGSIITGGNGSLSIGVDGDSWTCGASYIDGVNDDCYAAAPNREWWPWIPSWVPGNTTKLVVYNQNGHDKDATIHLSRGWTIGVSPHFVELEIVDIADHTRRVHAYTNTAREHWNQSGNQTINHDDGTGHSRQVDRIIVTDVKLGRRVFDANFLCKPTPATDSTPSVPCKAFTVGGN